MNIWLFLFFLLLFACELFSVYDIITDSKKKFRALVIASLIILIPYALVYIFATVPIAWKIAEICGASYMAIMLLLFFVGHIVMAINREAGEKIAELFGWLRFLVFLVLPFLPPAVLYASIGVLK